MCFSFPDHPLRTFQCLVWFKHNSTIKIRRWTVDLIGWQFLKWHTLITFRSTLALPGLPLLLGLLLLLAVQGGDLEGLLLAHLLRLQVAELEVLRLLLDDGLLLANLEYRNF